MKGVRWMALACSLAGCTARDRTGQELSGAPPVAMKGGPVEPVFRWEVGSRVDVRVRRRIERLRAGKTSAQDAMSETRFAIQADGGGALALVFENAGGVIRAVGTMERFTEAVEKFGYGEIVVSASGELRSLYLTEEADAAFNAALASNGGRDPAKATPQERALLFAARTPMVELWQYSVGSVPRQRMEPGVPLVIASKTKNPLGGGSVDSSLHYRLEGRVRCSDDDTLPRCVLLSYRYVHELSATLSQAREFAASVTGAAPDVSGGEASSEGFVVFEEETLFPRIAYRARTQTWSGSDPWQTVEKVRFEFRQATPSGSRAASGPR